MVALFSNVASEFRTMHVCMQYSKFTTVLGVALQFSVANATARDTFLFISFWYI